MSDTVGMRVDIGSLGELFVYVLKEGGAEDLAAVYANDAEGHQRLAATAAEILLVDMETCSWCTNEVPDDSLTEMKDGARVCQACVKDADPNEITY